MPYEAPEIPEILTRKHWDKKKSVAAKAQGRTGVGEQMDAVKAAHGKIKWDRLDLSKIPSDQRSFTIKVWDGHRDAALAEIKGPVRKLVEELYELRKVAEAAAKRFKSSKLVPKADTALAEKIAGTADKMGVSLNMNSLAPVVEKDYKAVREKWDAYANGVLDMLSKAVERAPGAISKLRATPTPKAVNAALMTAARDVAQQIGNLGRYSTMGYDLGVDTGAAKAIFEDLKKFANSSAYFPETATEEEVKAGIDEFERIIKKCQGFAAEVPA